jgi:hypothetical protein
MQEPIGFILRVAITYDDSCLYLRDEPLGVIKAEGYGQGGTGPGYTVSFSQSSRARGEK